MSAQGIVAFVLGFIGASIFGAIAAHAHDPYTGIHNKDGVLCCSGDDCKQALREELFDILPQGGYRIRSSNEVVQEGAVANSPDGNWHICRRSDLNKTVRCLMIPNGGV